jgi:hypothetical protein
VKGAILAISLVISFATHSPPRMAESGALCTLRAVACRAAQSASGESVKPDNGSTLTKSAPAPNRGLRSSIQRCLDPVSANVVDANDGI